LKRAPLMRPPALQDNLLRAALHPDREVAERAAAAWAGSVDLDTLDFGSVQLLPMLTARPDPLPIGKQLAAQITNVSRVTWLRTESHARMIAPAISDLREAGCDPVLMKGGALVYGHGVPARLRPMFDVDVLVDPDRLSDAAGLLIDRGFSARDAAGLRGGEPRLITMKHGEDFSRGKGVSIDLHWSALGSMRRPELAATLSEHAVPCTIAGADCRALGRADLLAVTIAHAADPWRDIRERWVGDCVLLVRGHEQSVDWELFASRGRDWRMAHQMLEAFDYLADVAQVDLPAETRRALSTCPVPFAVRARRRRKPAEDGTPAVAGKFARVIEDYEMEIADRAPLGARTGPGDFADFLVRRHGSSRRRELPGELAFAAAGRPWRTRRKLRALVGRPSGPGAEASTWPRYELGSEIRFGGPQARGEYLANGWWFPEDFGIWSRGEFSRVRLGLERPIQGGAELSFGIRAPLAEQHPKVEVDVVVNEHRLAHLTLDLDHPTTSTTLSIPPEALAGKHGIEIDFVVDRTGVPAELGLAPDLREIGIGLGELALRAA
jgi:hypothetical protein